MAEESKVGSEARAEAAADSPLRGLRSALKRLDQLLERAVALAPAVYGPEAADDRYRGLYLSREDAERLLAREPCEPPLSGAPGGAGDTPHEASQESAAAGARLAWLRQTFGLSLFDTDLLLLALAPELDRRYERLYAYLQDDVTRARPTVELALNLLCADAEEKINRRAHFAPDAPLIRHRLVYLLAEERPGPALLGRALKVDEQIVNLLLGQDVLDARLAPFCRLLYPQLRPEGLPLGAEMKRVLPELARRARRQHDPLKLHFHGPRGAGKRRAAEAVACAAGAPLLVADVAGGLAAGADFRQTLRTLFREAWFHHAVLYLDGCDELLGEERRLQLKALLEALAEDAGVTILSGVQANLPQSSALSHGARLLGVPFGIPDFELRERWWRDSLAAAGLTVEGLDVAALAGRFRLTPAQIERAIGGALDRALWRAAAARAGEPPGDGRPDEEVKSGDARSLLGDLFAAARAQSGSELAAVARKVEPLYTWDDIVLPDDTLAQLRELCQRVNRRHKVLEQWGFDQKLSLGKGANALFAGPSGVGKTMAAEIIARELELDLYKIDLSGVVSKYIGETEKNLDRIFAAAESSNAILFFDEADALFGKRSEVRDSHDRYANIEISYLLQKMEEYEGIAILATNLRHNLDEAFVRRLAFNVSFPFPSEPHRQRIWAGIWPRQVPLDADVDLGYLARQFKLSGGNIKNIALAAAFYAAEEGGPVTMAQLLRATRREYQKMGKFLSEAELHGPPGVSESRQNGSRGARVG